MSFSQTISGRLCLSPSITPFAAPLTSTAALMFFGRVPATGIPCRLVRSCLLRRFFRHSLFLFFLRVRGVQIASSYHVYQLFISLDHHLQLLSVLKTKLL
jgi:hypothetical protein